MLSIVYISLMAMGAVRSRDPMRARAIPTISNSLVNLGKMDITFHIGKDTEPPMKEPVIPFNPKPLPIIDECLCNSLRNNYNDHIFGGASTMINKILSSHDLFNFNKEIVSGPHCCESVEENSITLEFGSKASAGNLPRSMSFNPMPPIILDSFMPKKLPFAPMPLKPKAIEIFLFPKNKDLGLNGNKMWQQNFGLKPTKKPIRKDIKFVGDKDSKNTFDTKNVYDVKSVYNMKNDNDLKNAYDEKNTYEIKTVYDTKKSNDLKNNYDVNTYDNLKYETVQPVTFKKEIGIKNEEDDNKSNDKEKTREDNTTVSNPQ